MLLLCQDQCFDMIVVMFGQNISSRYLRVFLMLY